MRWIDQALRWASQSLLAKETGFTKSQIAHVSRGDASAKLTHQVNLAIRQVQAGDVIATAKAIGKRATTRDYPVEAKPAEKKLPAYRSDNTERAKEIQKQFPNMSQKQIVGLLERDQFTREKLAQALDTYRTAKTAAVREYTQRHVKNETLEEYCQRKTENEYAALSKAFKSRRETEKQRDVGKLLSAQYIDLTIENYGRGRGQWYGAKRL